MLSNILAVVPLQILSFFHDHLALLFRLLQCQNYLELVGWIYNNLITYLHPFLFFSVEVVFLTKFHYVYTRRGENAIDWLVLRRVSIHSKIKHLSAPVFPPKLAEDASAFLHLALQTTTTPTSQRVIFKTVTWVSHVKIISRYNAKLSTPPGESPNVGVISRGDYIL